MSQMFEEYVQKTITEHDKELARNLLQNGVSVDLVRKSIPFLSLDDIEELSEQLALAE